ncbi:MAG: hypothetical protein EAZ74_01375 [Alphaproteobacteria bacterium]|nr:MAG: hypothetical protein EAY76_04910 [Alphaproteobacteria bacterium]TAF15575.1 MAG: hypothetical protein EAZ74_01375 [Alphaproteobacteria bacterium]TAF41979.1 MAG: hypothetical protein EAZ66_00120 [Alphaproteobacteria bacterium]TAF76587.1 MAG: hypothetical protein EAZ52_03415 [Alphaproteobacteria bacterium]
MLPYFSCLYNVQEKKSKCVMRFWHGDCIHYHAMKDTIPITHFSAGVSTLPKPSDDASAKGDAPSLFSELVDAVNPLHHVPILSNAYRAATGETLSLGARIAGGGLYGGVIGAAASLVMGVAEEVHGEPLERTAMDALGIAGESSPYQPTPLVIHDLKADDGEAMLRLAQSQAFSEAYEAEVQRQQVEKPVEPVRLREMRDEAMGMTNKDKASQVHTHLQDTLIRL